MAQQSLSRKMIRKRSVFCHATCILKLKVFRDSLYLLRPLIEAFQKKKMLICTLYNFHLRQSNVFLTALLFILPRSSRFDWSNGSSLPISWVFFSLSRYFFCTSVSLDFFFILQNPILPTRLSHALRPLGVELYQNFFFWNSGTTKTMTNHAADVAAAAAAAAAAPHVVVVTAEGRKEGLGGGERGGEPFIFKFLKCFSPHKNGKKVLSNNGGRNNQLACLNGIRWKLMHDKSTQKPARKHAYTKNLRQSCVRSELLMHAHQISLT